MPDPKLRRELPSQVSENNKTCRRENMRGVQTHVHPGAYTLDTEEPSTPTQNKHASVLHIVGAYI